MTHYTLETPVTEVVLLDQARNRLQAKALRLLHLERRRVDQGAGQPERPRELGGDHAGRPPDVQHRREARALDERPHHRDAIERVLPTGALPVYNGIEHAIVE